MRKMGIWTLVLMVAAGIGMMGACGGGGGGGDGLPKSSPSYAGSSMPAVLDSTSHWDNDYFFTDIDNAANHFQVGTKLAADPTGSDPWSYETVVNGTISGTYTETDSGQEAWTPTTYLDEGIATGTYSDYADSGIQPPYVLAGSGSWEFRYTETDLYDGVAVIPTGIGTRLSGTYMEHTNFSSFMESTGSSKESYSGFMSGNDTEDSDGPWTTSQSANIAWNNLSNEMYVGLLDYSGTASYDGTDSTYVASGTMCAEGGPEVNLDGCVDFDLDLTWDWDIEGCWICSYPISGTVTLSTVDAQVMYDYGYTSNDDCYLYLVDADNNSAYEYTSLECDF